MNNCIGKEAEPEAPAEPEKPKNSMGGLLILLVVGLLGGGAALYYFKFMKPKQSVKGSTDLDEFDFDEYDEKVHNVFGVEPGEMVNTGIGVTAKKYTYEAVSYTHLDVYKRQP